MKKLLVLLFLAVLAGNLVTGQTTEISGKVTSSEDDSAFPGVTVIAKGTTIGTVTEPDGSYLINVSNSTTILEFSFVGMKTLEIEIDGRTRIDVKLEPDILGLEEVVVTALGITRAKKALGYSVQDIKGEEVQQAKETNIVNSLAGRIAGVQITSASGAVGASSRIMIRGINSFGNNQPLFVVDGTPISNDANGAGQWGGVDYGNNASDIDPENVESISILKGANAAALYGARARNGVVLITTKKGTKGSGLGVSVSNSTTLDQVSTFANYQNEYGQGANGSEFLWNHYTSISGRDYTGMNYQEWAENYSFSYVDGDGNGVQDGRDESWGPRLDDGLMLDQFHGDNQPWISHPDNVKDFYRTGITMSNNLTLTAGGQNSSARFSYTNLEQSGVIPNTDQSRNSINLNTSINPSDKFTLVSNINYISTTNDNLPGQGYGANNVMQSIGGWFGRQVDMKLLEENWETLMPATADWPEGRPYNWNTNYHNNPYWTVNKNTNARKRERIFGNVEAMYEFTDWLNIRIRYGLDYYDEVRKSVIYNMSNENMHNGGNFAETSRKRKESNADIFLNFNRQIAADIIMSGTVGANYRRSDYHRMDIQANRLTVPNLFTIGNVDGTPINVMQSTSFETNSIFGSLNLALKDYLFLDFTFRNDWSSTLPSASWSYFYPSASLGWIFTETFGLSDSPLSFGKLRASYAKVGSDTNPYQLIGTYASFAAFDGISRFSNPGNIPPSDLRPEMSTSIEFGGDFKLFMNRIGLDITYFNNKTTDQILLAAISTSTGYNNQLINAGEIETKGVEILLTGGIIRNPGKLNWDVTINWTKNSTMVNELAEGIDNLVLNNTWTPTTLEARVNEPYGQFYGVGFQRNDNGDVLVDDEGFPLRHDSPEVMGNMMPDWVGGIRNSFRYKNFNLSFLIDAKWGGDIYSVTKWFGGYAGVTQETVEGGIRETGIVIEGVNENTGQPNDIAISPQSNFGNWWGLTEPAMIDGTYVKFRELIIGYNIPIKSSFIRNANISLIGRNLAILYTDKSNTIGIDPETGYGTGNTASGFEQYQIPPTRSIGFKLKFDF